MDKASDGANMKKTKRYLSILKADKAMHTFYSSAVYGLKSRPDIKCPEISTVYEVCNTVIGPVLTSYIAWVISDARERHINKLFFLARDGKIMLDIAKIIDDARLSQIEFKYLYVSRLALRKALYSINNEEFWRYFGRDSIECTPNLLLKRTGMSEEDCIYILGLLGYDEADAANEYLCLDAQKRFLNALKQCEEFHRRMKKLSREQLELIEQYFRQEGLGEDGAFALVDSGWTGSMQRTLRMILDNIYHKHVEITGYYFGIQSRTAPEDGRYQSYYFDGKKSAAITWVLFNNNLFECWCMASHGMTIGYKKEEDICPVLNQHINVWYEAEQIEFIRKYAMHWVMCSKQKNELQDKTGKSGKTIKRLLVSSMIFPSKEEAKVYGMIPFCDDTTEAYMLPLARIMSAKDIWQNLILVRCWKKITKKDMQEHTVTSGWREGTAALIPFPWNYFMRVDCMLSYIIKAVYKIFT